MQQDKIEKPNVRKEVIFSFLVVVIFFGILGIWSTVVPLDTAAIAPGKIIVSGYQKSIQHLEGGIVKTIWVKEGESVKKNQVLITLEPTQVRSTLSITQHQLVEHQAASIRIQAELDNAPTLSFPSTLDTEKNKESIRIQQSIFYNDQKFFNEEVSINQQKIKQLEEQIRGVHAQMDSNKKQLYFIDKELKDVRVLAQKRLVKQSRLLSLERESARITGLQAESLSQIAQLEQKISEIKIEINKFESDHRQKLLAELKDQHQKYEDLSHQEIAQHDILNRTIIRSPIDGKVVGLQVHTPHAVIKPGEVLMNIVPQHEALIVEVRLNPLDIDVVHPGLTAQVRIASFNQRTVPLLTGQVVTVSADALVDEKTGQSYYLAQITISKLELAKLAPKDKLYPGMPVEAMIVTHQLTPWEYFITPVHRSFNRAFREE